MANVRAIRTRIRSVESTRKITKSMKMVAAAKLKRTQQTMNALRPYAEAAREMLARQGGDDEVGAAYVRAQDGAVEGLLDQLRGRRG